VKAIVVGGSVAGLATALALSRAGHDVAIAERDANPLPADPVEAFYSWRREGAPQVWHSHAFLARLRNLLRERAPDVYDALLAAGATEMRFGSALPPEFGAYVPEPGDEQLVLLGCRRITFEWVLRHAVLALPHVSWRGGVSCVGLVGERDAASGVPRVGGVRLRDEAGGEESWHADLVVDASGRRSELPRWLVALGAEPIEDERESCGIFYTSRFYRLREGQKPPLASGLVGMDLGYLKYALFPGDAGIFSVTLAADKDDEPLRAVMREQAFERAVRTLPPVRDWIDPERSEAVTEVRTMASLENRRRRFVRDGRPLVLGAYAVGDAAVCSNPMYGRGCSLAAVHAFLLADALAAHGGDAHAAALAFDAATRRELDPWYESARMQDRDAREVMAAQREGRTAAAAATGPGGAVDPKAFMRSVIQEGLFPAMRQDLVVLRAVVRAINLLTPPDAILADPDVMNRVLAVWRDREKRETRQLELGPPRAEMLRVLAAAA
jgi:2-polyprenyl-6-methoxyphenol hydroxylase-like FAD-dependent oxidoreductase